MAKNRSIRNQLFTIIFGTETRAGKIFDIALLVLILTSIVLVMIDSVPAYVTKYSQELLLAEWVITFLFTIEYVLRIYVVKNKWRYIFSFYGVIDLVSILPTFLGLFLPQSIAISSVRVLRLLRIFRIFKLTQFIQGRNVLAASIKASWPKIGVFLSFVVLLLIIIGALMYLIEGNEPNSGFTSIPQSIYWAVVTLTTVGYGDVSPITPLGKFIASIVMILGYGIIAVPTGIISVEVANNSKLDHDDDLICENCTNIEHDYDARFCKKCGHSLKP